MSCVLSHLASTSLVVMWPRVYKETITAAIVPKQITVIFSLSTRGRMTAEEVEAEWEKTRDIDNPLNPWVEVYKGKNKSYHRTGTFRVFSTVIQLGSSRICILI